MKAILAACLFFLLACNGAATHSSALFPDTAARLAFAEAPDTTTLGGEWFLQPVLASDTASGERPMLVFDLARTRFSGNTGCNPMKGAFWFSEKDSSLSFSDKFASTKMSCPGYNEGAFIKSLMNTNHYRLEKGMLILLTDNTELSRWTRKQSNLSRTGRA